MCVTINVMKKLCCVCGVRTWRHRWRGTRRGTAAASCLLVGVFYWKKYILDGWFEVRGMWMALRVGFGCGVVWRAVGSFEERDFNKIYYTIEREGKTYRSPPPWTVPAGAGGHSPPPCRSHGWHRSRRRTGWWRGWRGRWPCRP